MTTTVDRTVNSIDSIRQYRAIRDTRIWSKTTQKPTIGKTLSNSYSYYIVIKFSAK